MPRHLLTSARPSPVKREKEENGSVSFLINADKERQLVLVRREVETSLCFKLVKPGDKRNMKMQCEQLYQEMLRDIARCLQLDLPERDNVESCFWIASRYWELLKKSIDKKLFEHKGNEIDFFRNIKPRFTGKIQYFTILAETLMFPPEDNYLKVIFWKEELKRYWRFCEKNKDFVAYYESNAVYLDSIYFVRVCSEWKPSQQLASYDKDKEYCSSHDHLVRGFVANKMYFEYVREKLKEMEVFR